jgi:hypothetical protein
LYNRIVVSASPNHCAAKNGESADFRRAEIWILTIGPVPPEEFDEFKRMGYEMGFKHVESGPLVRSSYHASNAAAAH